MTNKKLDYYRILQVAFGADKEDIASSYRRLCKLYHPDINHNPMAEERMKLINIAYSTLYDDKRRAEYNSSYLGRSPGYRQVPRENNAAREENERALRSMCDYFKHLMEGNYEAAYELLSEYDRQYVTLASFCKWRKSVNRLFSVKDFSARLGDPHTRITLDDGRNVQAKKFYIGITEKNLMTQATDNYHVAKYTVLEHGRWRVFLGYRDLNEIAKMFERLSQEQERGEMARHWEEYCADTCRELDMLSLSGFIKAASREVYRYERYGQALTLACFSVAKAAEGTVLTDILESTARILSRSLRETDISAYVGNGVFAVLFVELKRRHAGVITSRLADEMGKSSPAGVGYSHLAYSGGELTTYIEELRSKISK